MTGAHLHGVGTLPGPAPALEPDDAMFARHGDGEPRIPTPRIRNPPTSAVACDQTDLLTW